MTKGFRFSDDCCRWSNSACKSKLLKPASPQNNDDDVNLRFILRKKNLRPPLVLHDPELNFRVLEFESALDDTGKKEETFECLGKICRSRDALQGCGRLDNYERLNRISRGSYGVVCRARDKRTDEIVAMKEMFDGMSIPSLREIDILKSLGRHPNIVEFKEVATDDAKGVFIVMEYAEFDLRRYMEKKVELKVKFLMRQLLRGVEFLHMKKVMHRDLKPSNILINSKEEVKICDFGLSRRMDAAAGLYTPSVGTGWYRAPELMRGEKGYTEVVDMWAVGCIMAEMLLRCGGDTEAGQRLPRICTIVEGAKGGDEGFDQLRRVFFPATVVTGNGFNLLSRLLSWEPSNRITAESATSHVWFEEEEEWS